MFKKLLFAGMLVLFMTVGANALTLAWDADPNPSIVGRVLYWNETGETDAPYSLKVSHATQVTLPDDYFHPGVEYQFVLTAYDGSIESGYSNPVTYIRETFTPPANNLPIDLYTPPASPGGLQQL